MPPYRILIHETNVRRALQVYPVKVNPYSYRVGKGTQSDGNVSVSVMVSTLYRTDISCTFEL